MAVDNTVVPPGGGGDSIRDIDRLGLGIKTQTVQLDFGGDNTHAERLVITTDGLPVQPSIGATWAITAAALPLPTGAATSANQVLEISDLDSIKASLITINTNIDAALSTRATEATLALIKAKTDNLDVLLSTRLKPADTLAALTNLVQMNGAIIAMNTGARAAGVQRVTIATDDLVPISAAALPLPTGASTEATLALIKAKTDNLDVLLSTRIKPADTLATVTTVTTVTAVTAITNALPAGANLLGKTGIDQTTPGTTNGVVVNAGDVDHDAVNTLKQIQIAGHASPTDVPPTAVSANGDRVRAWIDRYGSPVMRSRKIRESYTAVCRLAETAARLDQTFTQVANTNKQWATLHHTAAATKEVRLLKCWAYITSDTVAGIQGVFELRQISAAPVTGNPAITPTPHRRGGTAAEAVCLYLPTTAGTEAGVNTPLSHVPFDTGISGAVSTVNPVPILLPVVLYDASTEDPELLPPSLPVGVLDGWAVMVRTVGVPVLRVTIVFKFTEEIP